MEFDRLRFPNGVLERKYLPFARTEGFLGARMHENHWHRQETPTGRKGKWRPPLEKARCLLALFTIWGRAGYLQKGQNSLT